MEVPEDSPGADSNHPYAVVLLDQLGEIQPVGCDPDGWFKCQRPLQQKGSTDFIRRCRDSQRCRRGLRKRERLRESAQRENDGAIAEVGRFNADHTFLERSIQKRNGPRLRANR